jgi:hypothetical protein
MGTSPRVASYESDESAWRNHRVKRFGEHLQYLGSLPMGSDDFSYTRSLSSVPNTSPLGLQLQGLEMAEVAPYTDTGVRASSPLAALTNNCWLCPVSSATWQTSLRLFSFREDILEAVPSPPPPRFPLLSHNPGATGL